MISAWHKHERAGFVSPVINLDFGCALQLCYKIQISSRLNTSVKVNMIYGCFSNLTEHASWPLHHFEVEKLWVTDACYSF